MRSLLLDTVTAGDYLKRTTKISPRKDMARRHNVSSQAAEYARTHAYMDASVVMHVADVFASVDVADTGFLSILQLPDMFKALGITLTTDQCVMLVSTLASKHDDRVAVDEVLEMLVLAERRQYVPAAFSVLCGGRAALLRNIGEGESGKWTPLETLVRDIPRALLAQYKHEAHAVRMGEHLVHTPYLKALLALAMELGVDRLPCCSSVTAPTSRFKKAGDFDTPAKHAAYLREVRVM